MSIPIIKKAMSQRGEFKMNTEHVKEYLKGQIDFYDDLLKDIDEDRNSLRHKLELVQQKYEIYYQKAEDYKNIIKLIEESD